MEQTLKNIKLHQGLPNSETLQNFTQTDSLKVLVFDDLMASMCNSKDIDALMLVNSHHSNTIIIYTSQNHFGNKGLYSRSISSNTHIFFLMNTSRNLDSIMIFARQVVGSGLAYKGFQKMWNDVIANKPFSYLVLNCSPSTPADLRLSTDIFSSSPTRYFILNT